MKEFDSAVNTVRHALDHLECKHNRLIREQREATVLCRNSLAKEKEKNRDLSEKLEIAQSRSRVVDKMPYYSIFSASVSLNVALLVYWIVS
jgi:hypothetical protein